MMKELEKNREIMETYITVQGQQIKAFLVIHNYFKESKELQDQADEILRKEKDTIKALEQIAVIMLAVN